MAKFNGKQLEAGGGGGDSASCRVGDRENGDRLRINVRQTVDSD